MNFLSLSFDLFSPNSGFCFHFFPIEALQKTLSLSLSLSSNTLSYHSLSLLHAPDQANPSAHSHFYPFLTPSIGRVTAIKLFANLGWLVSTTTVVVLK